MGGVLADQAFLLLWHRRVVRSRIVHSLLRAQALSANDLPDCAMLFSTATVAAVGPVWSERKLGVHRRRTGVHQRRLLITLCAACHARVHRLRALRRWIEPALVPIWHEQHPDAPVQLPFDLDSRRVSNVALARCAWRA
jgi:hypothetical protein